MAEVELVWAAEVRWALTNTNGLFWSQVGTVRPKPGLVKFSNTIGEIDEVHLDPNVP